MIQRVKCYSCGGCVHTTPIGELCDYYVIKDIILCEKCLETIIEDWFETYEGDTNETRSGEVQTDERALGNEAGE